MSTIVCPKCGANLDAGARFCASCGQAVAGPAGGPGASPAAPGGKGSKGVPVLPIAIFGGGLVVLVGALVFMRSNAPRGADPAPGGAPAAASTGSPTAVPAPPAAPLPGAPETAPPSALSFPDPLPPASPGSGASPALPPGSAAPQGNRAPSTKAWKDPLAGGGAAEAAPRQAPRAPASSSAPPPRSAPGRPPAQERPVVQAAPQVFRTFDCRENAIFNITPEDIHITVDGQAIGTADRWDGSTESKKYRFRGSGTHLVKLSHEKYETLLLKFEVDESSIYRTADVELQMKRLER